MLYAQRQNFAQWTDSKYLVFVLPENVKNPVDCLGFKWVCAKKMGAITISWKKKVRETVKKWKVLMIKFLYW